MRVYLFLTILLVLSGLLAALVGTPLLEERGLETGVDVAAALLLTDLAIWTESRYTRHPSQADLFAPFQDGPGSLEHFPSGILGPPPLESWTWREEQLSPGFKKAETP